MTKSSYKSSNPDLQKTFEIFVKYGNARKRFNGACSNAYCVAKNTGLIPRYTVKGTHAYAAARAGLFVRERAIKQLGKLK